MRVMVNFMLRDCWFIHCVSEDAKTPISPILRVADQNTLIRLLLYLGATEAEIEEVHDRIRQWEPRECVYHPGASAEEPASS